MGEAREATLGHRDLWAGLVFRCCLHQNSTPQSDCKATSRPDRFFSFFFLCYRTPYSPLVLISLGYFCVLESGPCRSQPLAGQGRFVVDIGPGASTLLNGLESKLLAQISVCFLWGPLGDHLRRGEGGESPRCPPCFLPKPCFLCSPAVPETN